MSVEDLLLSQPEAWLDTLPPNLREPVEQLLSSSEDPLVAASEWLASSRRNKSRSGGTRGARPMVENIVREVRGFLCGDPRYEKDRAQISEKVAPTQTWLVSAVTAAIAPKLGAASAVIGPVVVLAFISFGKCTLNAICSTWKDQSTKEDAPSEEGE